MISSGVYNLTVHQGSTFKLRITLPDFNITGLNVRSQIREKLNSSSATDIVCTIFQEEPSAIIDLEIGSDVTAALKANIEAVDFVTLKKTIAWDSLDRELTTDEKRNFRMAGREPYYWDFEVYEIASPEIVNRFLTGRVMVTTEVTR